VKLGVRVSVSRRVDSALIVPRNRKPRLRSPVSPFDFGTACPKPEDVRTLVTALQRDTVPYRPTADRTRILRAFVRASVLAHTGARVGELAMLEPGDLRLSERAVLMPTEKRRRNAGRMEPMISRRRIPLNDFGVAALKMFVKHDLFDRLRDRSRSYVVGHSGFRERVLAIRAGEKRRTITESDVNVVLPLCPRDRRAFGPASAVRRTAVRDTLVGTASTSRASCGRVERRTRLA
jgi:integrase